MIALTEFRKPASPAPCTSTGTSMRPRLVEERPMPSFPLKLAPQVQTVPSDFFTTVLRAPPQMETTSAPNPAIGIATASAAMRDRVGQFMFQTTRPISPLLVGLCAGSYTIHIS